MALFAMAHSLSPKCTPLKGEYDSCFNSWFEGYLEPAVAANASHDERAAFSKKKADEFHAKCGMIWEQYRQCVQVRRISCVPAFCDQNRYRMPLKKRAWTTFSPKPVKSIPSLHLPRRRRHGHSYECMYSRALV